MYVHFLQKRDIHLISVSDSFKMIKIQLQRQPDMKQFLKQVLASFDLSTENVEKVKITKRKSNPKFSSNDQQHPEAPIFDEYEIYARTMRSKQAKTLKCVKKMNKFNFYYFPRILILNIF